MKKGSLLAVTLTLAATGFGAGWATINAPLVLAFPRDHGSHPEFRTEWWYATGRVADETGRPFGFQLTFFRQGLDPSPAAPGASALRARQALAGHLAVADIATGKVLFAERVRRVAGGLASASQEDLRVTLDDWAMERRADAALVLTAADRDTGIGLALELEPEKPLALEGEGGVAAKGPGAGNASAYVSYTRLTARGTLTLGGRPRAVRGEAWFDHEWGTTQLGPGVAGWDWLGVRLADGRELMLYRLRTGDGRAAPESAATLVERDGQTRSLAASEFTLEPESWWTSPRTGARYPARVRVRVPSAGLDLTVRPEVADAELDARRSTGTVYWEGPVAVTGTPSGQGYMELTGYAGPIQGVF